jgi:hypothetical protein
MTSFLMHCSDSLATYEASRKIDHDMLLVNSIRQLSICDDIYKLQVSSNSLLRDNNTTAVLSSTAFVEKLDAQIELSKKILSVLMDENNDTAKEGTEGPHRDFDANSTAVTFSVGKQTRISLEHLGRIASRTFLYACNIVDALVYLRDKIKSLAQEISTHEMGRVQHSSLGATSRELMNQASLVGQQLFRRRVLGTYFQPVRIL